MSLHGKLLSALLLLTAVMASTSTPASPLISEQVAQRHGLTRAWFTQVAVDRTRSKISHITQHNGMLFVQTSQGALHALDAETGRTVWSVPVGRHDHHSLEPAANDKYVAVINGSVLYLLDRQNGRVQWERKLNGSPGAGAVIGDAHVFVPMINGAIEGYKIAEPKRSPWIYRSNGRVLVQPRITARTLTWTTHNGYMYFAVPNPPMVKHRLHTRASIESPTAYWPPYIYACSLDGYVYAVNETTGETDWKFTPGNPIGQPPVAINGQVYVVADEGGMFCLDASLNEQWFAPRLNGFLAASPTRVYATDELNRLVILDGKTGARFDALPLDYSVSFRLRNSETDRIYLATDEGVVQCLHEIELATPVVYEPPKPAEPKKPTVQKRLDEAVDPEATPARPVAPAEEDPGEDATDDNGAMEAGDEGEPLDAEAGDDSNPFGGDEGGEAMEAEEGADDNPFD